MPEVADEPTWMAKYEALLAAAAKPTIVVDQAEYEALLAFKAKGGAE